MSDIKKRVIRALCRLAATQDERINQLAQNENVKVATGVTKSVYENMARFLNSCVDSTTKTISKHSKTITDDLKHEYQMALEEVRKEQQQLGSGKGVVDVEKYEKIKQELEECKEAKGLHDSKKPQDPQKVQDPKKKVKPVEWDKKVVDPRTKPAKSVQYPKTEDLLKKVRSVWEKKMEGADKTVKTVKPVDNKDNRQLWDQGMEEPTKIEDVMEKIKPVEYKKAKSSEQESPKCDPPEKLERKDEFWDTKPDDSPTKKT